MGRSRARKHRRMQVPWTGIVILVCMVLVLGAVFFWNRKRNHDKDALDSSMGTAQSSDAARAADTAYPEKGREIQVEGIRLTGMGDEEMRQSLKQAFTWNMTVQVDGESIPIDDVLKGEVNRILEDIKSQPSENTLTYQFDTASMAEALKIQAAAYAKEWMQRSLHWPGCIGAQNVKWD